MHSTLTLLARSFNRHTIINRIFERTRRLDRRPGSLLRQLELQKIPSTVPTLRQSAQPRSPVKNDGSNETETSTQSSNIEPATGAPSVRIMKAEIVHRHWLNYSDVEYPDVAKFLKINIEDYAPIDPLSKHPTWASKSRRCNCPLLSDKQYYVLRRLATAIAFASIRKEPFVKELLRWVITAQQCPFIFQLLTSKAWEILFKQERGSIPTSYTAIVGEIAESSQTRLTEQQAIDYIGGIFFSRCQSKAIQRWSLLMTSRKSLPSVNAWKLGVKLFALSKEPERAHNVYKLMTKTLKSTEPLALIPIIMSWNHLYQPHEAWKIYRKFRNKTKNSVSVEAKHLEDIALSFMEANAPELCFRVLKHMHKQGLSVPEHINRTAIAYHHMLKSADILQKTSIGLVDSVEDGVLDKYFYASWIKNLVRLGSTVYSLQVKDIMEQKGIKPDAQFVNGMIRGFLKEGKEVLAEKLAGEMIHKRLSHLKSWQQAMAEKEIRRRMRQLGEDFLAVSSASSSPEKIVEDGFNPTNTNLQIPSHLYVPLKFPPEADRQTISVLVLHFSRTRNFEKVHFYMETMIRCQIVPSAYIMNHLLNMYLRKSDMTRLACTFDSMVNNLGAKPDHETWLIMWFAMYKRYTQRKRRLETFLKPRELFRKMVAHIPPTKPFDEATKWAKNPRTVFIWSMLVRSFIIARDWDGLIIALNTGHQLWRIMVDEGVFKEISLGIFKKGMFGIGQITPDGRIGRRKVTRLAIGQTVIEMQRMRGVLSVRKKMQRLSLKYRLLINNQWKVIKQKIRKLPTEEAEAALDVVTRIIMREGGGMDSRVGIERLKRAREEMALRRIGLLGILPPGDVS